jgi:hypothetical protein
MGFGKRVIGEQAWEAQEAAAKAARDRGAGLGSRVTGPVAGVTTAVEEAPPKEAKVTDEPNGKEATPSTSVEGKPTAPAQLSLKELAIALEENETVLFFDEMVDAELARVEGPRKGGLRLLLKNEQAQDEPREAVVKELTAALKV